MGEEEVYNERMKLYLITTMILAGLCSYVDAAPKKKGDMGNLGNVLYIGDSITHGFRAPSYRWAMHKILVDNGIEYEEIGIEKGNHSNGVEPGTVYIARPFKNVHAAMSSQRAYETSGRLHPDNSNRLDKTDIFDWLAIEGKADSDKRRLKEVPNTCFILLGTNDTLSDHGNNIAKRIKQVQNDLLDKKKGDLSVIVDAIRKVNPKARVYVLSIPAWGDMRQANEAKDYEAVVKKFNAALAKRFRKEYVDLNQGLVDIACEDKPGKAVRNFMNAGDQMHPTLQGDLLMAGLVARTMGIAGRSAGLQRKAGSAFVLNAQLLLDGASQKEGVAVVDGKMTLAAGKSLVTPWKEGADVSKGFAVELQLALGDGPKNGWKKEPQVGLTLGNGAHTGLLNFSESYIMWGNTVLYPLNMANNKETVRVAWVGGNASQNVAKGFYVWLGDMLIGEGLPDVKGKVNGIVLNNASDATVEVLGLSADTESSAPATKNYVKEQASIVYDEEAPPAPAAPAAPPAAK